MPLKIVVLPPPRPTLVFLEQLLIFEELNSVNIVVLSCFNDHLSIHDGVGPMLLHWILKRKKNSLGGGQHNICLGLIRILKPESDLKEFNLSKSCTFFHLQIPPDRLLRSHITQYRYGYCKLEYLWGYYECTLRLLWQTTAHPVAVEYPHSTLNGTPTCSSHIGTALNKTQVADQEESGCV